ncbi:MAG: HTH-type transcriptional regulator CynR [Paracidovorax wautersii]|uniref:HTH-type transcriptional regulator CynR n=1 Tax=Paracidovorax wautersii TaxID=1177982 RepID=A0A7V8FM76_9BURK|nr:MAG: HTH-type transcriptional regulator CynR [Paracidovorax wautersii]
MDLKQLEYYVRVAEMGSFTRAAAVLNVAQPALSRQIRLLEVELRQNLLVRNGRGVTTTEAGKLLLEHGRGILLQVERTMEELSRVRGSLSGRVAIGLPPSMARALTITLTREFRKRLPYATLSISEELSLSMQESLLNGRLDIALLYNPPSLPELDIKPLMQDALYVVAPQSDGLAPGPLRLSEVARMPLVIPARANAIRALVDSQMAAIGCKPTIALEIDGVSTILDLVADGAGVAILPQYAVASHPGQFSLHAITAPALLSLVALATSARRTHTLTQQTVIQLLEDVCRQLFADRIIQLKE